MLSRFEDFDRNFVTMNQLRRQMERLYEELEPQSGRDVERMWTGRFPRVSFKDAGTNLVLRVDLPGLAEKDVDLTVQGDVLTLSGDRKPDAPEGAVVHRQERAPVRFSRTFALPCKVDAETSVASLKDGILTVTIAKAMEARPRQIAIKGQ